MAKVNVLISAAGWLLGFTEKLIRELKKQGVTDEAIYSFVTERGDVAVEKIADELAKLMKAPSGVISEIFRLTVNYDLSLETAIKAGKYDCVNFNINDKNFPAKRNGQQEVGLKIFHFKKAMTSEEAILEMYKQDYRPAEPPELLALGAKYPDEQRKYTIVALGSIWQVPYSDRYAVCLRGGCKSRELDLCCSDYDWSPDCGFAAVSK